MDYRSDFPGLPSDGSASVRCVPGLALVTSPLRLARDSEPLPLSWSAALTELTGWLGLETDFVPAPDAAAPVFAPWTAWSAAAFAGQGTDMPEAQFVASYCIDHPGAVDVMLVSPLSDLSDTGTLRAMIRAALAEERKRIALVCHAHQHPALTALCLGDDRALCPEDFALDTIAIEDAIPALINPGAPWDAIIVSPALRSIVFTLLAETSGVRGPWPMLWHNSGLKRVTCEVKGERSVRLPLDAPALIHALALTLHAGGQRGAALRLHGAWAGLRERGVTTPARGSDAPYATEVVDAEFIILLCRDSAGGRGLPTRWRALGKTPMIIFGSQMPSLRIVSANTANH